MDINWYLSGMLVWIQVVSVEILFILLLSEMSLVRMFWENWKVSEVTMGLRMLSYFC